MARYDRVAWSRTMRLRVSSCPTAPTLISRLTPYIRLAGSGSLHSFSATGTAQPDCAHTSLKALDTFVSLGGPDFGSWIVDDPYSFSPNSGFASRSARSKWSLPSATRRG